MSPTRVAYLLFAVAGLCMTWYYNLQFIEDSGGTFSVSEFVAAGATNAAAKSLSWDLGIACLTGLFWMFLEARKLQLLRWYPVFFLLTFGVAFAFAFPLFLFVRQTILEAGERAVGEGRG